MAATILLKNIPEPIQDLIFKVQNEVKAEKKIGQYSQENTIYKILWEYIDLKTPKQES